MGIGDKVGDAICVPVNTFSTHKQCLVQLLRHKFVHVLETTLSVHCVLMKDKTNQHVLVFWREDDVGAPRIFLVNAIWVLGKVCAPTRERRLGDLVPAFLEIVSEFHQTHSVVRPA